MSVTDSKCHRISTPFFSTMPPAKQGHNNAHKSEGSNPAAKKKPQPKNPKKKPKSAKQVRREEKKQKPHQQPMVEEEDDPDDNEGYPEDLPQGTLLYCDEDDTEQMHLATNMRVQLANRSSMRNNDNGDDDDGDEGDAHTATPATSNHGKSNRMLPQKPWKQNPLFIWSPDVRNPHLQEKFLSRVNAGILRCAAANNLELHKNDKAWLLQHGGRYEMYKPRTDKIREQKCYKNMSDNRIDALMTKRLHTRFATSPRLFNHNIAKTTAQNYEGCLRGFWNFLAMTGRFEDMIMLLVHPPPDRPSVSLESIE